MLLAAGYPLVEKARSRSPEAIIKIFNHSNITEWQK